MQRKSANPISNILLISVFSGAVSNGYSETTVTPGSGISSIGYALTPSMISPLASPRFPQNHKGVFENPRAPPPIPHHTQLSLLSPPTIPRIVTLIYVRSVVLEFLRSPI
jgi:hypothetical protein